MFMNTNKKHVGMIKIVLVFLVLILFLGLLLVFTPLSKMI
jgi:flagellar basal body-associated protein FliL